MRVFKYESLIIYLNMLLYIESLYALFYSRYFTYFSCLLVYVVIAYLYVQFNLVTANISKYTMFYKDPQEGCDAQLQLLFQTCLVKTR